MNFLTWKLKKISKRAEPSRDFDILLRHRLADAGFVPFAKPSFAPLWKTAGVSLGSFAMIFSGTGMYAVASDNVLPGDALYEVRQQIESLEETVAVTPERREAIKVKHLERRAKEARLLLARNKPMPMVQAAAVVQRIAEVVKEEKETELDGENEFDEAETDLAPDVQNRVEMMRDVIKQEREEMAELIELSNKEDDEPQRLMIRRRVQERLATMEGKLHELELRRKKMLGSRHVKPLEYASPEARIIPTDPR